MLEFYGTRMPHRGQWRIHQWLRRVFKLEVDADFEVTRRGRRWLLNPADFVQADLFWFGVKDRWDTYHLQRLVQPGSTLFDVGANIGYYAVTLAMALRKQCRVHAFEPFAASFDRLQTNIALNGLAETIHPHQLALSDREQNVSMTVRVEHNSGSARLDASGNGTRTTTLDAFSREHHIERLDLLKIDTEGHEEYVLNGALETLRRHRPIVFLELDPPLLSEAGSSSERVLGLLREQEYSLFTAHRDKLVALESVPQGRVVVNAFAFPL
jgi:FkbM family methyltransferase